MTPKEKAKDLVEKFDETLTYLTSKTKAIQCALLCVDEMLNNYEDRYKYCKNKQFLEEVKQEIQKI